MVVDLKTYHLYSYFKILNARAKKRPEEKNAKICIWPSLVSALTSTKTNRPNIRNPG